LFLGELVIIDTETAAQRLATEQGISVEDARLAIRSQEVAIRLGDLASLRYQTLDLASKVLMGLLALGAAALLELVLPSAFRLATLGGWLLLTGYVASERSKHKPPKSLAEALK
jgi:hypothetical protein